MYVCIYDTENHTENESNTENWENKMSNAEKSQWDYSWITLADKFQCDKWDNFSVILFCKAFQLGFSGVSVWLDFSVWLSVPYSQSVCYTSESIACTLNLTPGEAVEDKSSQNGLERYKRGAASSGNCPAHNFVVAMDACISWLKLKFYSLILP